MSLSGQERLLNDQNVNVKHEHLQSTLLGIIQMSSALKLFAFLHVRLNYMYKILTILGIVRCPVEVSLESKKSLESR
jgi:hypothetical protein